MASCCTFPVTWDDEIVSYGILWLESKGGEPKDVTGHAFEVELRRPSNTVIRTKVDGVQGGDGGLSGTDPNVVISWEAGDLTGLDGRYSLRIKNTTTGEVMDTMPTMRVKPA
jgi:hypothetical protein